MQISGFDSVLKNVDYGVPQGSVLGPLLFLIYINDLHQAIKYSKTRHFADDTNLLISNNSLKQLKKHLNFDLRQLCNWLKANKISLNCSKTEYMIFRHPNKQINYELKIKINGKKLVPSKNVKYLGIVLDPHLNWSFQADILATKLTRAAGMLSKIRHYVPDNTLRSIYFGIFSSLLTYASQVWGQFFNKHVSRLQLIQNKAIKIINFGKFRDSVTPLYQKSRILKLTDHVKLQNFLFVHNTLRGNIPLPLKNYFQISADTYSYDTRAAGQHKLVLPKARTQPYGLNSIKYCATAIWNSIVITFPDETFHLQSSNVCKKKITKYFIDGYCNP